MILRSILEVLPRRQISRLTGFFVQARRPRCFASALKHILVKSLRIDMRESELPIGAYASFGELFARALRPGARPIGAAPVVAPCDGLVQEAGRIENGQLLQCKGRHYRLEDLVGEPELAAAFQGGGQVTLYLAPPDYHRVHFPFSGTIECSGRIRGDLYPVNRVGLEMDGLFCRNERWWRLVTTPLGRAAVLMVGALNVGDMRLDGLPPLPAHALAAHRYLLRHSPPVPCAKGDPFGTFNMGSTVILLFSQEMCQRLNWIVPVGSRRRMGEDLLQGL